MRRPLLFSPCIVFFLIKQVKILKPRATGLYRAKKTNLRRNVENQIKNSTFNRAEYPDLQSDGNFDQSIAHLVRAQTAPVSLRFGRFSGLVIGMQSCKPSKKRALVLWVEARIALYGQRLQEFNSKY